MEVTNSGQLINAVGAIQTDFSELGDLVGATTEQWNESEASLTGVIEDLDDLMDRLDEAIDNLKDGLEPLLAATHEHKNLVQEKIGAAGLRASNNFSGKGVVRVADKIEKGIEEGRTDYKSAEATKAEAKAILMQARERLLRLSSLAHEASLRSERRESDPPSGVTHAANYQQII